MEENKRLMEELDKLKENLKELFMSDIALITEEQKEEITEKFNHELQGNARSCVFSIDGMVGMTGSKLSIMSSIGTLVLAAIDNKIFEDIDDACNNFREFAECTKDIKE